MQTENIVGLALLLSGAVIIAVCLPLLRGNIKPNALYGVRMAKSFESDENWFKMNCYGAKQMMLGAAIMMLCGIVAFFLPMQGNDTLAAIAAVVPMLLMLIPAFQIYRYSKTL